jgi:hypothetical protein
MRAPVFFLTLKAEFWEVYYGDARDVKRTGLTMKNALEVPGRGE